MSPPLVRQHSPCAFGIARNAPRPAESPLKGGQGGRQDGQPVHRGTNEEGSRGGFRVLDLTEDELGHRQVGLGSRATRMVKRTNSERALELLNRVLEIPLLTLLSITRESAMGVVCCVF